jgi:hypothetical protein
LVPGATTCECSTPIGAAAKAIAIAPATMAVSLRGILTVLSCARVLEISNAPLGATLRTD